MSEVENPDCPCTWDCSRHGKCSVRLIIGDTGI